MKKSLKRKLQLRFVLLSVAALLLLQGTIVSLSIWHSYQDMTEKSDLILQQLRDTPSANSRYFSVKVHPGKHSVRIDTIHNVSVTPVQAGEYAKQVLHSEKISGFIDGYRYQMYHSDGNIRIVFLSRHSAIEMYRNNAAGLIWCSVGGIMVMCIVLCILSGVVVKPLVENQARQKQFITAAGHQLKTPLTVIRTQGQLLQSEIGENQWLEGILDQTAQLTVMTNDLVALAKAEEYDNPITMQPFCLASATAELVDIYELSARRKQITIDSTIPQKLEYRGSEQELRQLLSILLDNACKYCPEKGQIRLVLKKEFWGICLSVSNPAEITGDADFTQRFFRGENATGKEGSGLGLAIAEAIVRRHKGKLTATAGKETFCVNVMLH